MFKMLIGISLVSVVAEMFISDSSFKKYVKAVFGVFTFVIMLEGVFSARLLVDSSILEKAERITENTISNAQKEIVIMYENNIREELLKNDIETVQIKVRCDSNLTIQKLILKLNDISKKEKAETVLAEKFGIDTEVLDIKGDG